MEDRAIIVRDMKICRFCLEENEPLTKIFERGNKQTVPLPLQIMACVAIEVFVSDGMPQYICSSCRNQTAQAYNFKTTCKKSDDALKLYVATGKLTKPSGFSQNLIHISAPSKKRPASELQSPGKRQAKYLGNTEILTLNFGGGLELGRRIGLNDEEEEAEPERILGLGNEDENFTNFIDSVDVTSSLTIHQEEHSDENDDSINPILKVPQVVTDVFPCEHCDRSFPLQQLLDIHIKNHERDRCFSCEECGRKFFTKYDLGKHFQTHNDAKPYSCIVCEKRFSQESLLHRHEKIHIDTPKYLCGCCDRTFLTKEDLDIHSEKHKKKRPFSCRLCSKSFVFKQGLERHELAHADQKPHKCNYCEASFTSPIKLTRHITSHAGLRPYPCKLCGRTFLLSHHLTRHMRSHYATQSAFSLPLGQHKCDVCSMSFRRKDSLINHSAIHSMVNLRCVICNTAFETAKMVKEHITTHLSGLPYPCDRCDYSFNTQDQLEEHELKHVEMEYEEQIEKEVTMEANSQMELDEEYNSEDADDDGVSEFTITNSDAPEVVRRSKRDSKIKNYAEFLKDEIGSDIEDEVVPQEYSEEFSDDPIKPVVRSEGTKMYTRKSLPIKPRTVHPLKLSETMMAPLEQITQPTIPSFESFGLAKHVVNALPDKKFIDMKIGDKTVRVQKLIMTRNEIQEMARQGKIEVKGNTFLLKSNRTASQQNNSQGSSTQESPPSVNMKTDISESMVAQTFSKTMLRRTYVKKMPFQRINSSENCSNGIQVKELNQNIINLADENVQMAISEVEINSQHLLDK